MLSSSLIDFAVLNMNMTTISLWKQLITYDN